MPVIYEHKKLFQHALKREYILPAFNVYNMESMHAILETANEERSPVIMQMGTWIHSHVAPFDKFVAYCKDCLLYTSQRYR